MIVYTAEQTKGLMQGLFTGDALAGLFVSGALLFPFVVLLFVYALAWFSVQFNAGRKGVTSFFVYLLVSSGFMFLILNKQPLKVEVIPLSYKEGDRYISFTVTTAPESPADLLDSPVVSYNSTSPPPSLYHSFYVEAPSVYGIFSLLDDFAHVLYYVAFSIDKFDTGTVIEKQRFCFNPSYVTRRSLGRALLLLDTSVTQEDPTCTASAVLSYLITILGWEGEERGGWGRQYAQSYAEKLKNMSDEEFGARMLTMWDNVLSAMDRLEGGSGVLNKIIGVGKSIADAIYSAGVPCGTWKNPDVIYELVATGVEDTIKQCQKLFDPSMHDVIRDQMLAMIEHYIRAEEGLKDIRRFLTSVSELNERMYAVVTGIGGTSWGNQIKQAVSGIKQEIAAKMSRDLNFDLYGKMKLLAEIQGVFIAFLLSVAPLVFLLALFPVGDSMINTKLLVSYMIGYVLVKLWIPAVYLVYVFVWNQVISLVVGKIVGGGT